MVKLLFRLSFPVFIGIGNLRTIVKCLIDSGSQQSYLSEKVLELMGAQCGTETEFFVSNFMVPIFKKNSTYSVDINFDSGSRDYVVSFLIDDEFSLNYSANVAKSAL